MLIAAVTFRLRAPWVHSLKEKRMLAQRLLARLRNRFHVTAAEVEEQDALQIIVIAAAAIVPHRAMADSVMEALSAFVADSTEAELLEERRELR